jgi:anti-anti-sigma regulatory factor
MSFTIQITPTADWVKVSLIGIINEDAEESLLKVAPSLGRNVIVNFKGVESINSCGVNAWLKFMRELGKGRSVIFEECTPEIVSQFNMTPLFRGSALINSVYADYACPGCGHSQSHFFVRGKNLPASASDEAENVNCEKCGKKTEMEEIEEDFFAWIES